jgi:hypothetical protein
LGGSRTATSTGSRRIRPLVKKHLPLHIRETEPKGEIKDALTPIPVRVRLQWTIGTDWVVIEDAWLMSWTEGEMLIYFRTSGMSNPTTVWVPKGQVRRR